MIKYLFSNIKFKIILTLFISLVSVKTFSRTVFLANTPRINPEFVYNMKNIPQVIANIPQRISFYIASLGRPKFQYQDISQVPESNFLHVAKDIRAYENKSTNEVYIKVGPNVEFDKKIIQGPDGKEFIIYYPKQ